MIAHRYRAFASYPTTVRHAFPPRIFVFLVVAMEDDGRATDDVVFDELVQIAVCLIEGDEVCVWWETVEEIQQRQPRDAYTVFKYIDVLVVVECGLFVDCLEKGRHVTVIVPDEIVPHRRHSIVAPHRLTASVIGVRYSLVLQLTEEGRLGRQSAIVQFPDTVHILIRKVSLLQFTPVRFQVFIVVEARC